MPIYEYECQKCKSVFEVQQSFSDEPLTKCTSCGGKVRKLFSPPAIIFKGSGFHCNDYKSSGGPRKSCPAASADSSTGETKCDKADECKGKCAAS
ncbi:MAG: FmdB family zinc ribbon protein [Armatimonadia bacterium]